LSGRLANLMSLFHWGFAGAAPEAPAFTLSANVPEPSAMGSIPLTTYTLRLPAGRSSRPECRSFPTANWPCAVMWPPAVTDKRCIPAFSGWDPYSHRIPSTLQESALYVRQINPGRDD